MDCSKSEDDFWNNSSVSGSNFFDENDDASLSETDVFNSFVQENTMLPIHSIISNKCLKIILDDIDSTVECVAPPPEETIKRMFYGEICLLNTHRTLEDKLMLLDSALAVGDGNIIISVIIFLKKSLRSNIFLNQLSKRKIAMKHYVNYVIDQNNLQELADLYMATGNIFNLKDIYYLLAKDTSHHDVLYKRLEQFNVDHAQNLYSIEDKMEIQDNMSFIEFQIKHKYESHSLIDQLINLCENEWEKGNGDEVICNLKKQFKMDDFQYDWVIMSVLCKIKKWDKLLSTFIKTVWVIKKRALKSTIRPDLFIIGIGRHDPPKNIIEQFLACIGDVSKSLFLAEKLKVHLYVVNYYIDQKDRSSLIKYLEKVESGSEALQVIHGALGSPDIKWRN